MKFGCIAAAVAAMVAASPACAESPSGPANPAQGAALRAGAPPVSDGTVKIGLLLDLTGPFSGISGAGSAEAARMAIEDFGSTVLGRPIELVVADHHDDPNLAGSIARDWFDAQQVDAVLDVSSSSAALIVQAIARNRDKIVVLSSAGAERLTNEACSPTSIEYVFDTYAVAHTVGRAVVDHGGDTWFFVTADYSFGYDLERDTAAVVVASGGKVLGHARHPLAAPDLSSYLRLAQQSEAKVVGLADAGGDMIGAVRNAAKLGMSKAGQTIAALAAVIDDVDTLGLPTAQGMMLGEPFYWDMTDATRAWSRRFFERLHKMPNSLQAGVYSATLHYLQAVRTAGTDATGPVMEAMRNAPIDDVFTQHGHIREDGVMIHDMRLFQVKSPAESRYAWDYLDPVATIPGEQAFQPLDQSRCPLVKR